jgi:two-component system sensor histidine kinase/response regulator
MDKESTIFVKWNDQLNEALIESKTECVALFGIDGKQIYSNPAFETLVHDIPGNPFINPTFHQLLMREGAPGVIFEGYLTLGDIAAEISHSIEARVYRKDDQLLIIGGLNLEKTLHESDKLLNLNSEVIELQHTLIKKKRKLEETLKKLKSTNNGLKTANATKDKLFSIIAHDIRSPLSSILGFSELLLENRDTIHDPENIKFIELIAESAKKTFALLDNLLIWAESQTGKLRFNPKPINLTVLISETLETVNPAALYKNISLTKEIEENIEIEGDENMLKAVLRNLISNAIKFTNEGGNIQVSVKRDNAFVEISVMDDGVGIDEKTQKNLFHPATNSSSLGTANEKGTGLGLILCKEFVEKHHGKIWVESEPGNGSRFIFTIPVRNIK